MQKNQTIDRVAHLDKLTNILRSDFAAQTEHFDKPTREAARKLVDMREIRKGYEGKTQSEIIDNLLRRDFTEEMIAEELVFAKRFDNFKKALKRVKRHDGDFAKHYTRPNREIF